MLIYNRLRFPQSIILDIGLTTAFSVFSCISSMIHVIYCHILLGNLLIFDYIVLHCIKSPRILSQKNKCYQVFAPRVREFRFFALFLFFTCLSRGVSKIISSFLRAGKNSEIYFSPSIL